MTGRRFPTRKYGPPFAVVERSWPGYRGRIEREVAWRLADGRVQWGGRETAYPRGRREPYAWVHAFTKKRLMKKLRRGLARLQQEPERTIEAL